MYPYSIPPEVIIAQQNDKDEKDSKSGLSGLLDNYITQNPKEGFLKFQVSSGAAPISGSEIVVSKDLGEKVYIGRILRTDMDGKTLAVSLPTPDKALSLSPGNSKPYATYDITVSAKGYLSENFYNVPVFEGITSVQPVILKPDVGAKNIKFDDTVYERNFDNL